MKIFILPTLLLPALLPPATASALNFEVGGIYYNVNGNEATVDNLGDNYNDHYWGEVNIPDVATYNGQTYAVTSIGEWAFSGCCGLTSITINN